MYTLINITKLLPTVDSRCVDSTYHEHDCYHKLALQTIPSFTKQGWCYYPYPYIHEMGTSRATVTPWIFTI